MDKYIYQSAISLARMIREGRASSSDIVKEHLERIKEHNEEIHALISVFEEEALVQARACDTEAAKGIFRGPLHGVPVTIKEQFWIKGKNSTTNFKMLKDFVAPEDAVIVRRIKEAGAIILGQTNVPKNLTDFQVQGDIYPEGKNPFANEHSPGGSTGGGAAALAAGFSTLELGADFGGSIRVPANFCGLYGLKPSENTVPLHGNIPLPESANTYLVHMAQAGPLARNVEDLQLLWKIIVGPHAGNRNIPRIDWKEPVRRHLSEYRIAWTDRWPEYPVSQTVSAAIENLVNIFIQQGGRAEKAIPDNTLHDETLRLYVSLFPYVVAQGMPWAIRQVIKFQLQRGLLKGFKKYARELSRGFRMNANHYGEVMLTRNLLVQRWEQFFNHYDFLICPVGFGPAFKRCKTGSRLAYEGREMSYIEYVWPYNACFNASGNPSLHLPLGLSNEGLPLGVQIVGPYWSEPELIQFAELLSEHTEGFVRPEAYK